MKRALFIIFGLFTISPAFAQQIAPSQPGTEQQKFEERKQRLINLASQPANPLHDQKDCIQKAQTPQEIRNCRPNH